MKSMKSFLEVWLLLSIMFCLMSYMNNDPIKACFFLIFSMVFVMPLMSFMNYVWFSYFICMLFLSGVFVILVYFSSLSSFFNFTPFLYILAFLMTLMYCVLSVKGQLVGLVGLEIFYYKLNFLVLLYLIMVMLFFMNFVSYFLNFSGALRSL